MDNTQTYSVIQANTPSSEALVRFNEQIQRIIKRSLEDGRINIYAREDDQKIDTKTM